MLLMVLLHHVTLEQALIFPFEADPSCKNEKIVCTLFFEVYGRMSAPGPQVKEQARLFAGDEIIAKRKTGAEFQAAFRPVDVCQKRFQDDIPIPEQGPLMEIGQMLKMITSIFLDLARVLVGGQE